jgi:site-specific DNA-methyltransferase (adenine-specific)
MPINEELGALPGAYRTQISHREKQHATAKPLALMQRILEIVPPGGLVVDPFAGSGTTLLAARTMGRDFLGCEMSPEYHKIAQKRLNMNEQTPTLF